MALEEEVAAALSAAASAVLAAVPSEEAEQEDGSSVGIYIDDIISRASDSAVTSTSVALGTISGQIPHKSRPVVSSADGMIRPISGSAIRLVRRKWTGNVPK